MKPSPPPAPFGITKRDIKKGEMITTINVLIGPFASSLMPNLRKEINMEKTKKFKDRILRFFRSTKKTGYHITTAELDLTIVRLVSFGVSCGGIP